MEHEEQYRRRALFAAAAICLSLLMVMMSPVNVYAAKNLSPVFESVQEEGNEVSADDDEDDFPDVVTESTVGEPISVDGNADLLDDIQDDGTKEFITVTTKNNQTFFIVIDRSNTANNVYMLSMIDEADLKDFLPDEKEEKSGLFLSGKTADNDDTEEITQDKLVNESEVEKAPKEILKKETEPGGTMIFLAIVVVAGVLFAGAAYYLKIYRPKKEEEAAESQEPEEYDEETEIIEE